MTTAPGSAKPWYREPLVWMLIAIPLSAVIGGAITLALAIISDDGLVVDDYYKRGKAINRVLQRDRAAAELGLRGELIRDRQTGTLKLSLRSRPGYHAPEHLRLAFFHATRAGFDYRSLIERVAPMHYSGRAELIPAGRWYVQLETDDWRLTGLLDTPADTQITLAPASPGGQPSR